MMGMAPRVSAGMSRAFRARSRSCPECGKKTVQPKRRSWQSSRHRCRWCGFGIREAVDQNGWCNFPRLVVPAPGEVGLGYKATCRCGKRVAVTVRGLFARHKPAVKVVESGLHATTSYRGAR